MNRRRLLAHALRTSTALVCIPSIRLEAATLFSQGKDSRSNNSSPSVRVNSRPQLVAHWKLNDDCQDAFGGHHGNGRRVEFIEGVDGRAGGAALFNGVDSTIEVPDAAALNFASEPFSVALWVKANEDVESPPGALVSKFDGPLRKGFNLNLVGSSSGYSSVGDRKGVHFGIDNGISGTWEDCGRPWKTNPIITSLTVYQGKLYAAIGDASRSQDACHIFRFEGPDKWLDCGRVGNDPLTMSAMSTIVHKGKFYAGTGTWDWERSNAGRGGQNRVYCYDGESRSSGPR